MEVGAGKSRTILPNFLNSGPENLVDTCALDFAEKHGRTTLDAVGHALNITRERVRQIQKKFMKKLKDHQPNLYGLFVDMQD